jgi:hypothetical protein
MVPAHARSRDSIHPDLGWAKLAALVEGAALAPARIRFTPGG